MNLDRPGWIISLLTLVFPLLTNLFHYVIQWSLGGHQCKFIGTFLGQSYTNNKGLNCLSEINRKQTTLRTLRIVHKYSSEFVYFLLDSSTQKSIPYKSVGMGDCQGMDTVREHSYSGYGGVLGRII